MVFQIYLNPPSTYIAGIYFLERRTLKQFMMNIVRDLEQDFTATSSEDLSDAQSCSKLTLDTSQSSSESKCQSDLETCSISSFRKSNEYASGECDSNVQMATRRVSFPKKDRDLVTGYLEPVNPWESVDEVRTSTELEELYKRSCVKHHTDPLKSVVDHLQSLDLANTVRQITLNLKDIRLSPESCEALEEIIKRVQYQSINLTNCHLNDTAASALFQMIEFYEAANELDISYNPQITQNGWDCCISMVKKTTSLQSLIASGLSPISDKNACNLGKAVSYSNLHILKLEHCGLTGKPLIGLCNGLRKSSALKELWIAYNDLNSDDADKVAELLKVNAYLQFLDISNNHIKDNGVKAIVTALIKQATEKSMLLPDKIAGNRKSFEKPIMTQISVSRSMLDALLTTNSVESTTDSSHTNANTPETDDVKECHKVEDILTCSKESFADEDDAKKLQTKEPNTNLIIKKTEPYNNPVANHNDQNEILANNNTLPDIKEYEMEKKISADNECTNICDLNKNNEDNDVNTIELYPENEKTEVKNLNADNCEQLDEFETAKVQTRSHSSDSLSSEYSVDMIESNLSAEVNEKLTKNDTLGRQKSTCETFETYKTPRGLQALILWNNNITRISGEYIGDLLSVTNSLELLNIGKNILSNDFIEKIDNALKMNKTLTSLGLQSAHLSCAGIVTLSNILQFGGNCSLQRIDIRDNNIQILGMKSLTEALKSNNIVARIDIDDEPKRLEIDNAEFKATYTKYLCTIRTLCTKNQTPLEAPSICANIRKSSQYANSRKISLTCQSFHSPSMDAGLRVDSINDAKKKAGTKLRSPLPSPPISSPSSSPVPSPSRSRFQVFRVIENEKNSTCAPVEASCTLPMAKFNLTVDSKKNVQNTSNHTVETKIEKEISSATEESPNAVSQGKNVSETVECIKQPDAANDIHLCVTKDTLQKINQPIVQLQSDQNILQSLKNTNPDPKPSPENTVRKVTAVDKLFNFFQNPSIFGRSTSSTEIENQILDKKKDLTSNSDGNLTNITEHTVVMDTVVSTKPLFFDVASKFKDLADFSKQVLKPNTSRYDPNDVQNTEMNVTVTTPPNNNTFAPLSQNVCISSTETVENVQADDVDKEVKEIADDEVNAKKLDEQI